ncbi:hypothetical protein LDENG_00150420 [Lucifuga dentata]|nr:hypothetical protein LDENG_00150420 [Lucifuga dentata]
MITVGRWNSPADSASHELKILLVGPIRTGKSSTGNTLLGHGQVFETRGGGASAAATTISAGRLLTVVDAQGWGPSENFVPRKEKIELLRALDLCGPGGPHVIVLVIPLLDFTEPERRAVERRMEILTSNVWRHTMVVFTFEDWLRKSGQSVKEHIQSGGPALQWLMKKCRYRYYVVDNKTTISAKKSLKEEVERGGKKEGGISWGKEANKGLGRKNGGGDECRSWEKEQEQVNELLSKVEDMLQENGGWHFSLHMYQRMEEEWKRREKELRARLELERDVERLSRKQETTETEEEEEGGFQEPENERGRKEKMDRQNG